MTDCTTWTGHVSPEGYGRIYRDGGHGLYAHRVAYEEEFGPIPDGMVIDHLCRNRLCVEPSHLEVVTNRENILRGTSPSAQQARMTHCFQGHEFTPENTYHRPDRDGRGRLCRTCERARVRVRYLRGRVNA